MVTFENNMNIMDLRMKNDNAILPRWTKSECVTFCKENQISDIIKKRKNPEIFRRRKAV